MHPEEGLVRFRELVAHFQHEVERHTGFLQCHSGFMDVVALAKDQIPHLMLGYLVLPVDAFDQAFQHLGETRDTLGTWSAQGFVICTAHMITGQA